MTLDARAQVRALLPMIEVISLLNSIPMPALRSLTLRPIQLGDEGLSTMPVLWCLHIDGHRKPSPGYWAFLAASSDLIPSLSHLTLSGILATSQNRAGLEHFLVARSNWHEQHQECEYCIHNPRQVRLSSWTRSVTLFVEENTIRDLIPMQGDEETYELLENFKANMEMQIGKDRELHLQTVPRTLKGKFETMKDGKHFGLTVLLTEKLSTRNGEY
jgi:hypothetical protein